MSRKQKRNFRLHQRPLTFPSLTQVTVVPFMERNTESLAVWRVVPSVT